MKTAILVGDWGHDCMTNCGFFVLLSKVLSLIDNDKTICKSTSLQTLTDRGELAGYKHEDFWQPMDIFRNKTWLKDLWPSSRASLEVWA